MFAFDNIGGKIKGLAKFIFAILTIIALIGGLFFLIKGKEVVGNDVIEIIGLLIIMVGPILAWINSWLLYGFGQLIENSDIIANDYSQKYEIREKKRETRLREDAKISISNPEVPNDEYIDIVCPECREELSYTKEQLQGENIVCPICNTNISL